MSVEAKERSAAWVRWRCAGTGRGRLRWCGLMVATGLAVSVAAGEAEEQAGGGEWLYAARWEAGAGPGVSRHEEVWCGPDGILAWRALEGGAVTRVGESATTQSVAENVRAAARAVPAGLRERGSRQTAPDAGIGTYLLVVLGRGAKFEQWGDEETFLPRELVTAARALLAKHEAADARGPAGGCWLQVLPLAADTAESLARGGYLVAVTDGDLRADAALAAAAATPFRWIAFAGRSLAVGGATLSARNPSLPVLLRGRAFQIQLQTVPTDPSQ